MSDMFYVEWQPCAICGASIDTIAGNPDRWATYFFTHEPTWFS